MNRSVVRFWICGSVVGNVFRIFNPSVCVYVDVVSHVESWVKLLDKINNL